MKTLLAVDPGINTSGVALFKGGELLAADAVRNKFKGADIAERCLAMTDEILKWLVAHEVFPEQFVFEWPQIYPKSKGDPNDLPHLAGIGMAIAGVLGASASGKRDFVIKCYKPREWKGNLPKGTVFDSRIAKALELEELTIWKETKDHNAKDAIGIGLKALGRF